MNHDVRFPWVGVFCLLGAAGVSGALVGAPAAYLVGATVAGYPTGDRELISHGSILLVDAISRLGPELRAARHLLPWWTLFVFGVMSLARGICIADALGTRHGVSQVVRRQLGALSLAAIAWVARLLAVLLVGAVSKAWHAWATTERGETLAHAATVCITLALWAFVRLYFEAVHAAHVGFDGTMLERWARGLRAASRVKLRGALFAGTQSGLPLVLGLAVLLMPADIAVRSCAAMLAVVAVALTQASWLRWVTCIVAQTRLLALKHRNTTDGGCCGNIGLREPRNGKGV